MLTELQGRGLLGALDVQLARALGRLSQSAGQTDLPGEVRSNGAAGLSPSPHEAVTLGVAMASRAIRAGHSCFPLGLQPSELFAGETLAAWPQPAAWAEALEASGLLEDGPLVLDSQQRLYLRRYWELEQGIAERLSRPRPDLHAVPDSVWLDEAIDRLFGERATPLARQAAQNAVRQPISLLCGGPGTGKTTVVASIVALLIEQCRRHEDRTPEVLFIAPTGKAAARLKESVRQAKTRIAAAERVLDAIPEQAATVHQALGMRRYGMRFRHGRERPLEADIIVVDEASMIDLTLMQQLLQAAPERARLLIVGDPDQLSSVEAGSVLRDLVQAFERAGGTERLTCLSKTYRYESDSPLGAGIRAIREGDPKALERLLDPDPNAALSWAPLSELPAELDRAAHQWSAILEETDPVAHFEARERYIMLSPLRRGPLGTEGLATALRQRLPTRLTEARTPILIEENDRELELYNGDFAFLEEGPQNLRTATVQRDLNQVQRFAEALLPRYSPAYALSVHKSQGSEFDEVLIVLPESSHPLVTRELLYTAVSRARRRVRLVGSKPSLLRAVTEQAQRHSGLADAISASATDAAKR